MLIDKFRSVPGIGQVSVFTILGLANVVGYGLSHLMTKEDYRYHFAYTGKDVGSAGSSRFAKSLIGSESLINTAANAGLLIGCGQIMQKKVGLMTMMKFAPLPFIGALAFYQAFSPAYGFANPKFKMGLNFDNHAADSSYYMGAD